jgi:transcriptional regulator with XRE-family HTH domain
MNIGERLRQLRLGHNMTLLDVKEKTGLSVSHLSDIERGRTKPSLDALESLAICYGITLADLMNGVDPAIVDSRGYPDGLRELVEEGDISDEWARMLSRIEFRGNRPTSTKEWAFLYYYLNSILEKDNDSENKQE